jgi:hypothetical protein
MRVIPKLTAFNYAADYFPGVPFDFIERMPDTIRTRNIYLTVHKHQEIPIGILGKIIASPGTE